MFEQAFKNIDDVLRKEAGCTTELDYTEQTSWLLFLKYLDGLEQDKADEAALEGKKYKFILDKPYRWEEWCGPKGNEGKIAQSFRERITTDTATTPGPPVVGQDGILLPVVNRLFDPPCQSPISRLPRSTRTPLGPRPLSLA